MGHSCRTLLWDLSYETSFKSHTSSLQNTPFARTFLQSDLSSLQSGSWAFRARLPLQKRSGQSQQIDHIRQPCQALLQVADTPIQKAQQQSPAPNLEASRFPVPAQTASHFQAQSTSTKSDTPNDQCKRPSQRTRETGSAHPSKRFSSRRSPTESAMSRRAPNGNKANSR